MNNLEKERKRLQELAKISDIIRKKYKHIKSNKVDTERNLDEIFKPVVVPLKKLVSQNDEIVVEKNNEKTQKKIKKKKILPLSDRNLSFDDKYHSFISARDYNGDKSFESVFNSDDNQSDITSDDENQNAANVTYSTDNENTSNKEEEDVVHPNENLEVSQSTKNVSLNTNLDESVTSVDRDVNIKKYIRLLKDKHSSIDSKCGVRDLKKGLMIGNKAVEFANGYIIIDENDKYKATIGLLELLLKMSPDTQLVNNNDQQNYRKIILSTNAHKKIIMKTVMCEFQILNSRISSPSS